MPEREPLVTTEMILDLVHAAFENEVQSPTESVIVMLFSDLDGAGTLDMSSYINMSGSTQVKLTILGGLLDIMFPEPEHRKAAIALLANNIDHKVRSSSTIVPGTGVTQ